MIVCKSSAASSSYRCSRKPRPAILVLPLAEFSVAAGTRMRSSPTVLAEGNCAKRHPPAPLLFWRHIRPAQLDPPRPPFDVVFHHPHRGN
jgi:hypothetical protein